MLKLTLKAITCFGVKNTILREHTISFGDVAAYAATSPNEPRQCILIHFNNCNFSKVQIVCCLRMVFFTPKHVGAF